MIPPGNPEQVDNEVALDNAAVSLSGATEFRPVLPPIGKTPIPLFGPYVRTNLSKAKRNLLLRIELPPSFPKTDKYEDRDFESAGDKPTAAADSDDEMADSRPETEEIETLVQNAGLVLLWPFLGTLFEHAGLMTEGRFRDEDAASRAVHVVQLSLGDAGPAEEIDLALNKVLCGLPLDFPVRRSIEATDIERDLVKDLLTHVLRSWKTLSTTSVQGFQGSFLIRRGQLSSRDDGWRLKVERKAYDILLETLPWSISVVKTSWMKNPILVDWR